MKNRFSVTAGLLLAVSMPALAQTEQGSGHQKSGQQNAAQPQAAEIPEEHRFAGAEPTGGPAGDYDRILDPAAINLPSGYEIEVFAKGLNFPTDITFGENGEAYLSEAGGHFYGTDPSKAPPPRILQVMPDGTTKVIYDNAVPYEQIQKANSYEEIPEGLIGPIEGVTYNPDNGLLYIAHRTRYSTLDPKTGEFNTIIDNLPAWGIFHNTKAIFDDQGRMVFGVSAQGNSGPVDFAIMKVISFYNKPGVREVPCEDVTLTGEDYWVENQFTPEKGDGQLTGVFVPYGEQTEPGQTVPGEFWCNSALYRANADGTDPELLAWGVRNAFHQEFGPDGRIYFSNNSGNPIPGRPVYDDWETIYALEEGAWYGWPDYYSSVPITDPRFHKPDDPQFKPEPGRLLVHEFALTEETRARLLKGNDTPPPPLVRFEPHAGSQGFTFAPEDFGLGENEILLAEFGAVIPYEVAGEQPPGFQVSRIDLNTGERQPFAWNKSGKPASAAPGQPEPQGGGLERPVRLEIGPDGALYVVDFGVFDVAGKPKDKPTKMSFADSGVIWKVTRTEQAAGTQENKPDQAASVEQQMFRVRIMNVSEPTTLDTKKGAQPVPISPGAWAVHTGANPIFVPFELIHRQVGDALEQIAEDGGKPWGPPNLATALEGQPGVEAAGVIRYPESADKIRDIRPGEAFEFIVPADPGDQLSFAVMFAPSNDLFYAPYGTGIPLFADGKPISGDVTSMIALWDAGTEPNQPPGTGSNQAPLAPVEEGPNVREPVRPISYVEDPYEYPRTTNVIKVVITPVMEDSKPDQTSASAQQNAQGSAAGPYDKWAGEDGELTVQEWDAAIDARFGEQAVNFAVSQWDADGDGVISREEFDKAAAQSELLKAQSK